MSSHSSESQGTPGPSATLRELRVMVLIGLTLVTVFALRQAWLQQRAVTSSRPNIERLQIELARMEAIKNEFARFGSTHPDFMPILIKYGITDPGQSTPRH